MTKPVVFFGSSVETLPLLDELRAGLAHEAYQKSWNRSFPPGSQTLNALRQSADGSDFAIFVFGPDDWTESRSVAQQAPRDNVVFEAGLFGGVLGFDRVYIVHEENVKVPSDLDGFTCIKFKKNDAPEYQVQHAVPELCNVIRKKGPRQGRLSGIWWQYHMMDSDRVEKAKLALMKIDAASNGELKIYGKAWTEDGELLARFHSLAASTGSDPFNVFYYWEGDWPTTKQQPEFHGRGEIKLTDTDRASGWYTTESDAEGFTTEKFIVEYVRGSEEDLAMVEGKDSDKRVELIRKKLRDRPEFSIGAGHN